ncbi:MAG: Fe-S cluster protein [Bacteroidetes bacterium]|nr:MAG: Fe-S cluster protein [Bacteroidota bacterium]
MNANQPIYTEDNNCQDCYKCVRHCPVKAIRISNNCASVIDELCIACGNCVEVCPVGAKKVRSDIEAIKHLLVNGKKVILSLAPSWVSSFPGVSAQTMISQLKQMGFYAVSETALGAELVNRHLRSELLAAGPGISLSSACPTVVEYIKRHKPEYTPYISNVFSPLIAHASYLKSYYGPDVHVAFAGPCIAKKREADSQRQLLSAAITFCELSAWMEEQWFNPEPEDACFEPVEAVSGSLYPVEGGMIAGLNNGKGESTLQFMSFSGIEAMKGVLNKLDDWKPNKRIFIELLSCPGGCINGPAIPDKSSMGFRYSNVLDASSGKIQSIGDGKELVHPVSICTTYEALKQSHAEKKYAASDIMESLRAVGKQTSKDELNCGGCGYESCQEFAIAMLEEKAERNMCVSYMRRVAHDKASVLLQRMPSGVMIVDENLKVIECNINMARMLGEEIQMIYEVNPGLTGADVKKLVPFHKLFDQVLTVGKDLLDKEFKLKNRLIKVSVFSVQAHKIVCAIARDLYNPEVRTDEVVKRTRSIITENLGTVQKIAYLLGENASKTETSLNSILEILTQNEDE